MPVRTAAAAIVLALGLAGCSGGEESGSPAVAGPSQATETAASVATTAAAVAVSPTTTSVPTTIAVTTTAAVAAATPGAPIGEYQPTTAPTFPTRTALPAGEGLPDGTYYAVVDGAAADASPRLRVTIYELLTGPDAITAAAADGVGLDGDLYVRAQPAVTREIELTPQMALSVARPDQPGVSYAISPAELVRLVAGDTPGASAPDGYHYLGFPYLVTALGGAATRFEQLWSP
jgi:hypothetical protein